MIKAICKKLISFITVFACLSSLTPTALAASIPADSDFRSAGEIVSSDSTVIMDSDDFRIFAAEQRAVQRDLENVATKMEELATIRTEINTLKTDLVTSADLSTVAGRLKDLERRMGDASSGIQDSLNSINSRCDGLDIRMSGLESIAGSTSYNIAYDYDGGTASNPDCYTGSTDTFTLNNPTKTGYRFIGWTGTLVSSQTMTVSVPQGTIGDLSFTAHWEPITYYVKYDANGGSGAPSETLEVAYGENVVITSTTPSRANYVFQGWSKSSSATTATYTAGNSYKNLTNVDGATVILYAVWKIEGSGTLSFYSIGYVKRVEVVRNGIVIDKISSTNDSLTVSPGDTLRFVHNSADHWSFYNGTSSLDYGASESITCIVPEDAIGTARLYIQGDAYTQYKRDCVNTYSIYTTGWAKNIR